ncbi:hypothetical protein L2E82_25362 [Cichorium intybus]|uniref:Uncharacterized protein n=1 Tax=Cichorium intybus TaxID=13427 RepID=A0ACB9E4C3_CICIN|nr:hypothetical protein L2E82_25362 [Cichorium intybus]
MSVAIGTIAGTSGGERGKRNVVVEGPPVVKATQQKQRRMINTRESGATSRSENRRIFSKAGVDNTRLLEATGNYVQRQPKVIGESAGSMLGRDLEDLMQRARDYKKEYGDYFICNKKLSQEEVGGIENSMNLKPFTLGIDELINEFAEDELIEKFADSQSYDYGYWVGRTVCLRVNTVSNDPNATFWKTRICSKWETIVQCVFGDKCHFAHRLSVNTVSNDPNATFWKTRICSKWETIVQCVFGDKCHFAHGLSGKWRLLLCGIKAYTMHKMWAFTYMDMYK